MMKTYFRFLTCLTAFLYFCQMADAQVRMTYAIDRPAFLITHLNTDKYNVVDSSLAEIAYKYRFRMTEDDDSLQAEDDMWLLIGKRYVSFFSINLRNLDDKNTESMKTTLKLDSPQITWQGYDIMRDMKENMLTVNHRVPFTQDVCQYIEPVPNIQWTLLPEDRDTIMGYRCQAAEGEFGGRKWKVWYTDLIPVPLGPWKLGGLKGLILRAVDSGQNFIFEVEGLAQKRLPVKQFDWKYKKMSKDEWMKFETYMYNNAGKFVKNNNIRLFVPKVGGERGLQPVSESWQEYYNPLEK
ncbi:MAG: GLPGLI family protein [Prevotella sp.]|nr:GLPGLI family protein [Prevotella sp.]